MSKIAELSKKGSIHVFGLLDLILVAFGKRTQWLVIRILFFVYFSCCRIGPLFLFRKRAFMPANYAPSPISADPHVSNEVVAPPILSFHFGFLL